MRTTPRISGLLAMAVLAVSLIAGTAGPAQAATATGTAAVTPDPDAEVEIFPPLLTSTKCLDVPFGSNQVGTAVQIFHCHGGGNQLWNFAPMMRVDPFGNQLYEVFNQAAKDCLGGPGGAEGSTVFSSPATGIRGKSGRCANPPSTPTGSSWSVSFPASA